eukprot:7089016-Alexandrium_andersonii.AAC.1
MDRDDLAFPLRCCFWRRSEETRARHRCQLFSEELGIGPQLFVVDPLRCLGLGVCGHFVAHALWALIRHNVHRLDTSNESVHLQAAVHHIRAELMRWYPEGEKAAPPEDRSRLQDLSPAMLGPWQAPLLRAKGAEGKLLVWFACDVLGKYSAFLPSRGVEWLRCGVALKNFLEVLKGEGRVMRPTKIQGPTD